MPNYISEIELQPSGTLAKIKDEAAQLSIIDIYNQLGAIDAAHVYNESTPTSGLTTNIGLKEGTYNITANTTISAQLVVPKGAVINVSSGVTLTINGNILAGLYQIFTGSGTVKINGNSEVYPEWWGAVNNGTTDCTSAIQKAVNSIDKGVVIFQSGRFNIYTTPTPLNAYKVTGQITLKEYVSLRGVHRACINTTAGTTILLSGSTDGGSLNFHQGNYIENIIFFYAGNLSQPSGYNRVMAIKNHGTIRNVIRFCEFYNFYTAYYTDTIVANYFLNNTVHVPNYIYSTGVYLNDNIVNSAIYPNASQHIDDSIFLIGDQGVGVTAIGDILSDLFIRNNEFGGGYRAVSMSIGNGANKASYDIHITDNIMDNIANAAIDCTFADNETSALLIRGNWIAHRAGQAILLQHVYNANISDNLINGTLGTGLTGIALVYCRNIIAKGNIIESCETGIDTAIGQLFTITDNSFVVFNNSRSYAVAFRLGAQVHNSILGNNIIDAANGTLANGITVSDTGNVINWNKAINASDSIAAGNIVNGANV